MSRSERGWGPFSGGQLTVTIVTVAVLVLFPVGAWAVGNSNVFVTDATSGAHAAVSASGALSVSGSVTANNASAKNLYVNSAGGGSGAYISVAEPPSGKALVITSLSVDTYFDSSPGQLTYMAFRVSAVNATCASVTPVEFGDVNPSGLGVTSIPIPSGLVVPANRALCAITPNGGMAVVVTTFGYLVPAASAPTGDTTRTEAATRRGSVP